MCTFCIWCGTSTRIVSCDICNYSSAVNGLRSDTEGRNDKVRERQTDIQTDTQTDR